MKIAILGVVLVGLLGLGYFYYQSSQSQTPATVTEIDSMIDNQTVVKEDIMAIIINDKNSLTGQLEDVSGGNSNGTAYLLRKDGVLYHYVEAELPEPNAGLVYEGWLVNKTPSLKFVSTGMMEQINDTYTLSYTTDNEYTGYNEVVITLETKVDATPEEHVIEGVVR